MAGLPDHTRIEPLRFLNVPFRGGSAVSRRPVHTGGCSAKLRKSQRFHRNSRDSGAPFCYGSVSLTAVAEGSNLVTRALDIARSPEAEVDMNDINYLLSRERISLAKARQATSPDVRAAHAGLARIYGEALQARSSPQRQGDVAMPDPRTA